MIIKGRKKTVQRGLDIERWLAIPDTHAPYHDTRAWALMLQVANAIEFHGVVILGDFYDCYAISDYRKDPRRERSFKKEITLARAVRKPLDDYGFKYKKFIKGNHEWRLERYLEDRGSALYEEVLESDPLRLAGWDVTEYMNDTQIGRLNLTHDIGYAGVTSTRRTMLDYQDNVVIGHNHILQYHVEGNAKGVTHVGASFGWLGDVARVDYKHQMKARKEWVKGFGILTHRLDNDFVYVKPVVILPDYSCEVDGRLFVQPELEEGLAA